MVRRVRKVKRVCRRLEEIFSEGSLVYVDASCMSVPGKRNVFGILKNMGGRYSTIDPVKLDNTMNELEEFGKVFEEDVALTTPEIVSELAEFKKRIKSICQYFAENNSRGHDDMKSKFRRLKGVVSNVHAKARGAQTDVVDRRYDLLVEMIVDLSESFKLKKDLSFLTYGNHNRDQSYDNDHDERFVAMAYYSALYDGFPVSVLSNDGDVDDILVRTSEFIGARSHSNFSRFFRFSLGANPIKSYGSDFDDPSSWKLGYDSGRFPFSFNTKRHNLENGEFLKLHQRMGRRLAELDSLRKVDDQGEDSYEPAVNAE